ALLDEFAGHGDGHAAGGFGEDAFGAGEEAHGVGDLGVADVVGPPAGVADQLGGEVAVGRVADGQRLGDGVRLANRLVRFATVLDGVADRVAAGRLGAEDFAARRVDQAKLVQL